MDAARFECHQDSICPRNTKEKAFIQGMLDQIVRELKNNAEIRFEEIPQWVQRVLSNNQVPAADLEFLGKLAVKTLHLQAHIYKENKHYKKHPRDPLKDFFRKTPLLPNLAKQTPSVERAFPRRHRPPPDPLTFEGGIYLDTTDQVAVDRFRYAGKATNDHTQQSYYSTGVGLFDKSGRDGNLPMYHGAGVCWFRRNLNPSLCDATRDEHWTEKKYASLVSSSRPALDAVRLALQHVLEDRMTDLRYFRLGVSRVFIFTDCSVEQLRKLSQVGYDGYTMEDLERLEREDYTVSEIHKMTRWLFGLGTRVEIHSVPCQLETGGIVRASRLAYSAAVDLREKLLRDQAMEVPLVGEKPQIMPGCHRYRTGPVVENFAPDDTPVFVQGVNDYPMYDLTSSGDSNDNVVTQPDNPDMQVDPSDFIGGPEPRYHNGRRLAWGHPDGAHAYVFDFEVDSNIEVDPSDYSNDPNDRDDDGNVGMVDNMTEPSLEVFEV